MAVGPHQLSAEDVVKAFCRDDNQTPYLQVKTFNNHRGWFFRAEQLYDTLSNAFPNPSQIPTDVRESLKAARIHIRHSKDLLKTPLAEAQDLAPGAYGPVGVFVERMARLAGEYGMAKPKNKRIHGQTAGSSRWQERVDTDAEPSDEDMD